MLYSVAANLLVLIHLAFIIFVITGGFAVLKWRWLMLFHLPAVAWAAIIEIKGWVCPLTPWENSLRHLAGDKGYTQGFIDYYISPIIYPPDLTRDMQTVLGLAVIAINLLIYGFLIYRFLKTRD